MTDLNHFLESYVVSSCVIVDEAPVHYLDFFNDWLFFLILHRFQSDVGGKREGRPSDQRSHETRDRNGEGELGRVVWVDRSGGPVS